MCIKKLKHKSSLLSGIFNIKIYSVLHYRLQLRIRCLCTMRLIIIVITELPISWRLECFVKNFWHNVTKYGFSQGPNPLKKVKYPLISLCVPSMDEYQYRFIGPEPTIGSEEDRPCEVLLFRWGEVYINYTLERRIIRNTSNRDRFFYMIRLISLKKNASHVYKKDNLHTRTVNNVV